MALLNTFQLPGLTVVRGSGCYLYDDHDREYLDLLSGTWCCALGHSHPRLISALQQQMDRLVHLNASFASPEIERASERLLRLLPPRLNRVVWLNTGSEAVELALKIARLISPDEGVVVWEKGYYGATNLASALSHGGANGWCQAKVWRAPAPHCSRCPVDSFYPECDFVCLDGALASMKQAAAALYEPVMAVGGVIVPPSGYGRRLQDWARRLGAVLILEEVTTGMGRTGQWFGFQHEELEPDVLVLGKVLGNGLPVAAVVTTAEVEERCAGRLRHVQSHQNDPWSGAIAATVIDILEEEDLIQRCATLGAWFLDKLADLVARWPVLVEARGLGLMAALEFHDSIIGAALQAYLLREGVIVDYREATKCLRFFPPYIVPEQELNRTLETIERGLRSLA
ncbi:MAG TPA: aspartate aminotransferase family protein [Chloroflexi bacterium]|nr:aspartate aminotransferase family protein [Chloroflexota bacterium]